MMTDPAAAQSSELPFLRLITSFLMATLAMVPPLLVFWIVWRLTVPPKDSPNLSYFTYLTCLLTGVVIYFGTLSLLLEKQKENDPYGRR